MAANRKRAAHSFHDMFPLYLYLIDNLVFSTSVLDSDFSSDCAIS